MAGIAMGQKLTLLYDGHAFVPSEPVEFKKGSTVQVTVTEIELTEEEILSRYSSVIGTIHAPEGFNWDFDRDELYRDVA